MLYKVLNKQRTDRIEHKNQNTEHTTIISGNVEVYQTPQISS